MAFEQDREFRLHLLARAVMSIAVVQAHRCAHAVLVLFRTPAATERADVGDVEPAVQGRNAVEQGHQQVRMMTGDGALRDRLLHGLEQRTDGGYRRLTTT